MISELGGVLLLLFAGIIGLAVFLANKAGYNKAKNEQIEAENEKLQKRQMVADQPITPSDAYDELRGTKN